MIFLWDDLIPGSFLLISSTFSQLLHHSCLSNFERVSLVHSFKGYCSVQFSRSPINLWVDCFQEGVSQQGLIVIYFSYKEFMFLCVVLSADFQDCEFSYFSCFVWGTINVLHLSWFLQCSGGQFHLLYQPWMDEVFGCSTVQECVDFDPPESCVKLHSNLY